MMSDKDFEERFEQWMSDHEFEDDPAFERLLSQVKDDHVRDVLKEEYRRQKEYLFETGSEVLDSTLEDVLLPLRCWETWMPGGWIDPRSYNPYTGMVRVYVPEGEYGVGENLWLYEMSTACTRYIYSVCRRVEAAGQKVDPDFTLEVPDSVWLRFFDTDDDGDVVVEHEVSICEEL